MKTVYFTLLYTCQMALNLFRSTSCDRGQLCLLEGEEGGGKVEEKVDCQEKVRLFYKGETLVLLPTKLIKRHPPQNRKRCAKSQ